MPFDILTFGEALVEIMRVEIVQPLDQPGPFVGPYPSGAPFIFAMQAARLGASVAAAGAVGRDAFGRHLLNQFQADGIDTSAVHVLDGYATGAAFVAYAQDGSRDFVFHIAQAAAGQIAPDLLDESLFEGLGCLHLMGSTLSIHDDAYRTGLRALDLARKHGAKISFDPNLRPQLMPPERARDAFAPFIAAADILIPTAEELALLTGTGSLTEAVDTLAQARGALPLLVITRGKDGCTVYTDDGPHDVPGFRVEEIDPTGAGDCFDAGLLVRWLAGDSLAEAARFANACGALAVTRKGPAEGAMPDAEVRAFIDRSSHPQT